MRQYKILGIDPGTTRVGYGVIQKSGPKATLLAKGLLNIRARDKKDRLCELEKEFASLIATHQPHTIAFEKLYFSNNQKTALDVAEARGILLLTASKAGIPFFEYTPSQVKSAVTGYGMADKQAVAKMVSKTLGVATLTDIDDVTDALAIAITAAYAPQINMARD